MFAIVEDGSRQLRVQEGETFRIDYRDGAEPGQTVTLGRVLLANGGGESVIAAPEISGATIVAEVVEPLVKGEKLEIQKFRRRKNMRKHTGHRQKYTTVKINSIKIPGLQIVEKSDEK